MPQPNVNTDPAREAAEARERLLRAAEEEGLRPLSFDELLGDPDVGDPEKEDVDDFLALRREWREAERARGRH